MAAKLAGRPVKLALTRQQMFSLVGYRTPTIQRLRLGADARRPLTAIAHDVVEQTSTLDEFAEQTAVATRMMYAAPNRRTTPPPRAARRAVADVLRAPGECPGMFALESAMDEMADRLRARPDRVSDPQRARASTPSRAPVQQPRPGRMPARRRASASAGTDRDPRPATRRDGRWLVGTGVAARPIRRAGGRRRRDPRRPRRDAIDVLIDASDIGTGAWTALTQIAADALEASVRARPARDRRQRAAERVRSPAARWARRPGGRRSSRRPSSCARGCATSYGGVVPADGLEASAAKPARTRTRSASRMHAFGAQFAEVRVDVDTGEVRVPRLLGVFAAGRIINPKTARSQLLGGMTMGLSMALHEESVLDPRFGDYVNHDFAEYHIADERRRRRASTCAGSTRTIRTSTRWERKASARSGSSAPPRRSPTPSITRPASASATCRYARQAAAVKRRHQEVYVPAGCATQLRK